MEFKEFSKIPRLSRDMVITEKIDGTNAQILIFSTHNSYNGEFLPFILHQYEPHNELGDRFVLLAGSRTRWITPGKNTDNHGFAGWAYEHRNELLLLGEGRHYGEWWGKGIQRGYELSEKRFSLFNTSKWTSNYNSGETKEPDSLCIEVPVCNVVPILFTGIFSTNTVEYILSDLRTNGSFASPGFMKPEGVVIYQIAGGYYFKKTIENDESPKSLVKEMK